jgi:hypothetical protein
VLVRYHRSPDGHLGDTIPFFWDETWHVFYLGYKWVVPIMRIRDAAVRFAPPCEGSASNLLAMSVSATFLRQIEGDCSRLTCW